MGFNISGLVINKNYENNLDDLQQKLGWSLQKVEDINFETASENWKEPNICDVYFTETGTILFLGMDKCMESYPIEDVNTLSFILSEVSMSFNLNYCENGINKRSFMATEGMKVMEEGEELDAEHKNDDLSEVIWEQIGIVLGIPYMEIDLGANATRYHFQ